MDKKPALQLATFKRAVYRKAFEDKRVLGAIYEQLVLDSCFKTLQVALGDILNNRKLRRLGRYAIFSRCLMILKNAASNFAH